jgi:colanic acid biosynthesis glycosyl transferase WcaI
MKRLVFLNRFFYPDLSATSQVLSDLAFHLAALGEDVHVVTSQQLYYSPRASLPRQEVINNVHIHRVPTTWFGRAGLWGRGIDYASYYGSMWLRARALVGPGDVVIAKTDPPLTSVVAMLVTRERGARLVNWLQDIYPETAAELGVPLMQGLLGRSLGHLRDVSLRSAVANIAVGEQMGKRIRLRGVVPDHVYVIPNWTNDEEVCSLAHEENPLRSEWGLTRRFVAGYSGNLGRAHEFETVLSAAQRLRDHPHIVFLFAGGGYQFDQLARAVTARNLQHVFRFVEYQRPQMLKYSLNVPDVHLISLKPELEGLIVPSKFYGIAAVGRPMISIGASDGEIARLLRQHECGLVIEPGNGDALAEALVVLSASPQRVSEMGKRARAMLDQCFTRKRALGRWHALLLSILRSEQAEPAIAYEA